MLTRRELLKGVAAATLGTFAPFESLMAQRAVRVRKDLTQMLPNDPFFAEYAAAIKRMHELPDTDRRNWRNQALIHADHCPHGMIDFLEWHRYYITYYETICGEMVENPNFSLPYWNWENNEGRLPAIFFEQNPLNVEFLNDPSNYTAPPNSRTRWGTINSVGTRNLTASSGLGSDPRFERMFSAQTIENIKRQNRYELFSRMLEGSPHNNGHVIAGQPNGHMINGLSPLDPIFWLHHCNVDRIWAEWQNNGNTTDENSIQYQENFCNAQGTPVDVVAKDSHDHVAMGFTYDSIMLEPALNMLEVLPPENSAAELISQQIGEEEVLGELRNEKTSMVGIANNLRVKTSELGTKMFSPRTFKTMSLGAPREAAEFSRILAVLKDVSYPPEDKTHFIVNVFVDCPYLSPDTPSTDPHFAGSFSFFGQLMRGMTGGVFVIDLSDVIKYLAQKGRLSADEINVQLMPVAVKEDEPLNAEFKVGRIEILRV